MKKIGPINALVAVEGQPRFRDRGRGSVEKASLVTRIIEEILMLHGKKNGKSFD